MSHNPENKQGTRALSEVYLTNLSLARQEQEKDFEPYAICGHERGVDSTASDIFATNFNPSPFKYNYFIEQRFNQLHQTISDICSYTLPEPSKTAVNLYQPIHINRSSILSLTPPTSISKEACIGVVYDFKSVHNERIVSVIPDIFNLDYFRQPPQAPALFLQSSNPVLVYTSLSEINSAEPTFKVLPIYTEPTLQRLLHHLARIFDHNKYEPFNCTQELNQRIRFNPLLEPITNSLYSAIQTTFEIDRDQLIACMLKNALYTEAIFVVNEKKNPGIRAIVGYSDDESIDSYSPDYFQFEFTIQLTPWGTFTCKPLGPGINISDNE